MTPVMDAGGAWVATHRGDPYPDVSREPTEAALALNMEPHPEGCFFREVYRSPSLVSTTRGWRPSLPCALVMVTSDAASRWHRLESEEVWLHQAGAPIEHYVLPESGRLQKLVLGPGDLSYHELDMEEPERLVPWVQVPVSAWQAARLVPYADDGSVTAVRWGLVMCVVAPGFDFEDFEIGGRRDLLAKHADVFARLPQLATLLPER